MDWRLRIWRRFLISLMHLPRTCRTSSQAGDAVAITMAEPPVSYRMTFLPLWWILLLQPKASWRGWTGEIWKDEHLRTIFPSQLVVSLNFLFLTLPNVWMWKFISDTFFFIGIIYIFIYWLQNVPVSPDCLVYYGMMSWQEKMTKGLT